MPATPPPGTISTAEAEKLLMIDKRQIQRLAAEDWYPRAVRGRYQTVLLVQGYIKSIKHEKKNDTRLSAENRVRDARARDFEVRTAKAAGELIAYLEAEAVQDELVGEFRSALMGLGASITRDLTLRRKIDAAADAVLERLHARALARAAALAASGEAPEIDTETEPG